MIYESSICTTTRCNTTVSYDMIYKIAVWMIYESSICTTTRCNGTE